MSTLTLSERVAKKKRQDLLHSREVKKNICAALELTGLDLAAIDEDLALGLILELKSRLADPGQREAAAQRGAEENASLDAIVSRPTDALEGEKSVPSTAAPAKQATPHSSKSEPMTMPVSDNRAPADPSARKVSLQPSMEALLAPTAPRNMAPLIANSIFAAKQGADDNQPAAAKPPVNPGPS